MRDICEMMGERAIPAQRYLTLLQKRRLRNQGQVADRFAAAAEVAGRCDAHQFRTGRAQRAFRVVQQERGAVYVHPARPISMFCKILACRAGPRPLTRLRRSALAASSSSADQYAARGTPRAALACFKGPRHAQPPVDLSVDGSASESESMNEHPRPPFPPQQQPMPGQTDAPWTRSRITARSPTRFLQALRQTRRDHRRRQRHRASGRNCFCP
jgi:hypothetical protein